MNKSYAALVAKSLKAVSCIAIALAVLGVPGRSHALDSSGTLTSIKLSASSADHNFYLALARSGGDATCTSNSYVISENRANAQDLRSIALAASLSGRPVKVWWSMSSGICDVYAISLAQ